MSTQHPDNFLTPPWSASEVVEGEAELLEAFYAYNDLGCDEVMWDSEGKDVDTNVIRKLFSYYPEFFQKRVVGEDVFLTYRVPNPQIEVAERKIVTETLNTIPLSADVGTVFHKRKNVPVFEVILPFTTSGKDIVWLRDYYSKAIAGAENLTLSGSMKVKDWIGDFRPKEISVIPLVEDMEHLLLIDRLVKEYLDAVKVDHLRVFIARSDPALNYGMIPAVLLAKIALFKLHSVEEATGVGIHPMIGVGSMPFRGHLSPPNVEKFLEEYRGLNTVTVQSACSGTDYPAADVKDAISRLNSSLPNGAPSTMEPATEQLLGAAMGRLIPSYQARIEELAPFINSIARYVPRRRARKLHIGLFGYSRNVRGKTMPRAIPFAAAFSPSVSRQSSSGQARLAELKEAEWDAVKENYVNLGDDFRAVAPLVSWQTINMMMELHPKVAKLAGIGTERFRDALGKLISDISTVESQLSVKPGPSTNSSKKHENFTNNFLISFVEGEEEDAHDAFNQAAQLRQSLG